MTRLLCYAARAAGHVLLRWATFQRRRVRRGRNGRVPLTWDRCIRVERAAEALIWAGRLR